MRYRKCFLAGVLVAGVLASTTSPVLAATFTAINVPGATSTQAFGINERSQIVGFYFDGVGELHGFLLDRGTFTTIDAPGATSTEALGINAGGQIVGRYFAGGREHGFVLGR